ncbi:ComEC/Rec2 family competence protein [Peptostreptococcus sp. D1]|uniref:ComEC/Rec2 family competence protein n=1 Tax=Peptostreptococcus sp. D1 TaxID=72304 RepID=UPI0008F077CC|nr:MBL fold metallo-hydrolase [Peptostreptococcus sp. D1]SFE48107.1 Metallo-beta-lactamase superfamily protein [Peptostreptococcus sp. D1]
MKKILKYIIVIAILIFTTSCSKDKALEVHVIDVDQGDSTLIITPDKKSILIDAGEDIYARNVIRELKISGVNRIDIVVATHFDKDHIGGLDKIVNTFKVSNIFVPPGAVSHQDYYEFINSCKNKCIKPSVINDFISLKLGAETAIDFLSPIYSNTKYEIESEITDSKEINKNSIVFLLRCFNHKLIFTGDIDSEVEDKILNLYNLENTSFLKVAHHGSKSSTSENFIKELTPKISSISCGYGNRYGHPHKETLNTLNKYKSRIYRTDVNGTMTFYFTDKGIYSKEKYE